MTGRRALVAQKAERGMRVVVGVRACVRLGQSERRVVMGEASFPERPGERRRSAGGGAACAGCKQPGGQHGILLLLDQGRPLREQGWLGSSAQRASNARDFGARVNARRSGE